MTRLRRGAALTAVGIALVAAFTVVGRLLRARDDGWLERFDGSVVRWFAEHRTDGWSSVARALTFLADTGPVVVATTVLAVALAVGTRRWRPPLLLALAVGGQVAVYYSVRLLVQRPRPAVPRLGPGDPLAGFPSGHTSAAVCLYGGLAVLAAICAAPVLLRRLLVVLALVVPPVVTVCRMYGGFHHPTDSAAGLLIGGLWLTAVTVLTRGGAVRPEPQPGRSGPMPPPAAGRRPPRGAPPATAGPRPDPGAAAWRRNARPAGPGSW
jgi:membrane-associated phospholipid phosphatase